MPVSTLAIFDTSETRRIIAETDRAVPALDKYRAELAAKPLATPSPLMERLKAKGYDDAEADDALADARGKLRCMACDALAHATCECGTSYVRAGWRFFADRPELLKEIKAKGANGGNATAKPADATKVAPETVQELRPMTSTERSRRHRAKSADANGTAIDKLFPKGSPACDFDFEHGSEEGDDDGGAFMRARAVKWQMLEAERLAVECALLRDGTTSAEVKKVHIATALKIARHWTKLAEQLRTQRRRP